MQDSLKSIWQRLTRRASACERYETLVSLYADGMASQKEARLVEEHVAACDHCRAHLSAIRATSGVLAKNPEIEFPVGLSERLRLAIAQERMSGQAPARRTSARALAPRLAFAGVLATMAIVAVAVHDMQSQPQGNRLAAVPVKGVTAPNPEVSAPVTHGSALTAPPSLPKMASSEAGKPDSASVIPHKRTQNYI